MKEIKSQTPIEVEETTRRRVEIVGNAAQDFCGQPVEVPGVPSPGDKKEFVLIVVKLAKVDANKGILGVLISNNTFKSGVADDSFKLDGDGTVTFWKGAPGKFAITAKPLYVFNPNKGSVILEIVYGSAAKKEEKAPPKPDDKTNDHKATTC